MSLETGIRILPLALALVILSIYYGLDTTDPTRTKQFLVSEGYSKIVIVGDKPFFVCDTFFNTEFKAETKNGEKVSGVVCTALFTKVSTKKIY